MIVHTGLEVFLKDRRELLAGQRVGIVVNQSSVNRDLLHAVDLFQAAPEFELSAVMGPQHGLRGETQDNMIEWEGFRDPVSGLPYYSLYGHTRKPTPEMLEGLDALVFDMQDVGARYYTFVWTMVLAMQACREKGLKFVVLDRPNPINGADMEGPVLDPAFSSFVGLYPLAIRHGMTVGELASYFNREFDIDCRLEVVAMQGWQRDMYFEQTGLPWILPSPNIPTVDSAVVYPGMCPLEGTNVSEGRGTTRPFELSGAPWVQPDEMVRRLSSLGLKGVRFRPVSFIPTFHKWSGQAIGGVQIHVEDRRLYQPFRTGLAVLQIYRRLGGGQFHWNPPPYEYEYEKLPIDILCGTDVVRRFTEEDAPLESMEQWWKPALDEFRSRRQKYLLYE